MWYKKWWVWILIIISVGILIGIPFVINYAYLKGSPDGTVNTAFYPSDMILFYGSILTLIGTMLLSALALWQNKQIFEKNEKLQNRIVAIDKYPLFVVEDMEIEFYNEDLTDSKKAKEIERGFNGKMAFWRYTSLNKEKNARFLFHMKNIGNHAAVNISLTDGRSKIKGSNVLSSVQNITDKHDKRYIASGDSGITVFTLECAKLSKPTCLYMEFYNPFGSKYSQKITISSVRPDNKLITLDFDLALNID